MCVCVCVYVQLNGCGYVRGLFSWLMLHSSQSHYYHSNWPYHTQSSLLHTQDLPHFKRGRRSRGGRGRARLPGAAEQSAEGKRGACFCSVLSVHSDVDNEVQDVSYSVCFIVGRWCSCTLLHTMLFNLKLTLHTRRQTSACSERWATSAN